MSKIEHRRFDGAVELDGQEYKFDAVVFRHVQYSASGHIGATAWQFGRYNKLRVIPSVPDHLRAELEKVIARQANMEDKNARSMGTGLPGSIQRMGTSMPVGTQAMKAIYELAKELGVVNKDLVAKVRALGIEAKNHMSRLTDEDVERVKRALTRERQENTVQQRVTDTVIRRRTKDGSMLRPAPPHEMPVPPAVTSRQRPGNMQRPAPPPVRPRVAVVDSNKNRAVLSTQLEEKIGTGSYADVWRATDKLGRKVAVKVLRRSAPYYFDAMQHARALARTQHPNVVTIYSLETVTVPDTKEQLDGILMELIEGPTLHDKLKTGRLDQQEALSLCEGLIDGLEHIHSVGLIHNDLHTKNVLITKQKVKIIDILYTESLAKLTTGTKEDRVRHDKRELTTMLFDISEHSTLPAELRKEFGYELLDSTMSFASMRKALRLFVTDSDKPTHGSAKPAAAQWAAKLTEAYVEITEALHQLNGKAQVFIAANGCRLNSITRTQLRHEVLGELTEFHRIYGKWQMYWPQGMNKAVAEYQRIFSAISAPPEVAMQYPDELVNAPDPGQELSKAYDGIISIGRQEILDNRRM